MGIPMLRLLDNEIIVDMIWRLNTGEGWLVTFKSWLIWNAAQMEFLTAFFRWVHMYWCFDIALNEW